MLAGQHCQAGPVTMAMLPCIYSESVPALTSCCALFQDAAERSNTAAEEVASLKASFAMLSSHVEATPRHNSGDSEKQRELQQTVHQLAQSTAQSAEAIKQLQSSAAAAHDVSGSIEQRIGELAATLGERSNNLEQTHQHMAEQNAQLQAATAEQLEAIQACVCDQQGSLDSLFNAVQSTKSLAEAAKKEANEAQTAAEQALRTFAQVLTHLLHLRTFRH